MNGNSVIAIRLTESWGAIGQVESLQTVKSNVSSCISANCRQLRGPNPKGIYAKGCACLADGNSVLLRNHLSGIYSCDRGNCVDSIVISEWQVRTRHTKKDHWKNAMLFVTFEECFLNYPTKFLLMNFLWFKIKFFFSFFVAKMSSSISKFLHHKTFKAIFKFLKYSNKNMHRH